MLTKKLLPIVACVALFFSCKKDEKDTPGIITPLTGKWALVSVDEASYYSSASATDSAIGNARAFSYRTTGMFEFKSDSLLFKDYDYDQSSILYTEKYRGGELKNVDTIGGAFFYGARDGRTKYKMVGEDSVVIGSIHILKPGGQMGDGEKGYHISWIGDTLLMTYKYDSTRIDGNYRVHESGNQVRKFVKQ